MIITGIVSTMPQDIAKILRSLHTTAVNRCRERLDEAALRAKNLISREEGSGDEAGPAREGKQYGITSVLKRRHGL